MICQALAVWVAVIYVSGMVGISAILGRDRGREQSCLSGLVITLGLGERSPLPSGQPLAPVAVDIHVHENEKVSFSVAPATFKCPLTTTPELLAAFIGSSETQ